MEYTPETDQIKYRYQLDVGNSPISGRSYEEAGLEFDRWLAEYRESVIGEVEDHLVRRDQFTERTLTVIDELREKK